MLLGIDYGTGETKFASLDPAGKAYTILSDRNEPSTPTVIAVTQNGTILLGKDGEEQGCVDPVNCIRDSKLRLGTTENLLQNGQVMNATDVAEHFFRYVKETGENKIGTQITDCVITCPHNFLDNQKEALMEAAAKAGLKVLKVLHEPTAAGSQ